MQKPQRKLGVQARWLVAVASLGLVACSGNAPGLMPVIFEDLPVLGKVIAPATATLLVRIEVPRETQAVSAFSSIKVTLSNASLQQTDKVSTLNTSGSTLTSVFTNLRPGSGYSVSVITYDALNSTGNQVQTGITAGVSLATGANTVNVTMVAPGTISGAVTDAVPSTITLDSASFNLSSPSGVVTDSSGNLLFTDGTCRILKKNSSNGTYSVLAGSGVCATSGECTVTTAPATTCDGTGTGAKLSGPQNMSIDGSDNLYFMDAGSKCLVRRSTPGGTISTMLGGSGCGYSNAANYGSKFLNPQGVIFDPGVSTLYIGDTGNHKIRKVPFSDGQAADVTGGSDGYVDSSTNGAQVRLNSPKGVALDTSSNATYVYVADSANNVIRRVTISDGTAITVAGSTGGLSGFVDSTTATSVRFNSPSGLALGADGFLYVADTGNHAIRKVNVTTGETTTVAGNGSPGCNQGSGTGTALLTSPKQVSRASDGKLYIANTGCNKVSVVQ